MPDVSVVILTMGDRSEALEAAVDSVRLQRGVDAEIVLVVNGGDPDRTIADIVVEPGRNVGVPGGRNLGAKAARADLILFLDDDARLIGPHLLERAVLRFRNEEDLAVLALRLVDEAGNTARRHLPGLRRLPPMGPADVTAFPGGAAIVRRRDFDALGGLCTAFGYALEETDFAWRVLDRGGRVSYDPSLEVFHPRTEATRHTEFFRLTARNRVWLSHRRLPFPLVLIYPANWLMITVLRNPLSMAALKATVAGTLEGLRALVGPREPIRWLTVWRLCRLGRPPII